MKAISVGLTLLTVLGAAASGAATVPGKQSITLAQDPYVMRLDKDEFRIAFGIDGRRCVASGCNGLIRYRVKWTTEDGVTRSRAEQVEYSVLAGTSRTIAVDRQYFDTAEGKHRTDVVAVKVDAITCSTPAGLKTAAVVRSRLVR